MVHAVLNKQIDLCCGVYFLSNFFKNRDPYKLTDWGVTESERKRNYPQVTQAWLEKQNKEGGCETKDQFRTRIRQSLETQVSNFKNKKSYFLAILNHDEVQMIEDILLDVGFEILVPLTKNPTGSSIVMYIYHLLPRPVEKKVVKSVIPRGR